LPTYLYRCEPCDEEFEKILPVARYREPQNCPNCNEGPAKKLITGGTGFILRGDGWAGKNNRINNQMRQKNRRLTSKQDQMKRDAPSVTLAPNVEGQQVGSWSEASKLAASKGKNTSGYDARARQEKKK
jgi:putative FmdB family regulatory protein